MVLPPVDRPVRRSRSPVPRPAGVDPTVEVIPYDVPDVTDWFDPDEAIPFHRDAGPGDHTDEGLKSSHPYAALFYEGDDPAVVLNFSEGTMQPALARRLAAAAVEAQPALGELSQRMEIYFEDSLAWEIGNDAVPVINTWITYRVSGDNPRSYAVGAVIALEVAVRESGERYLRPGQFVGPVAVQRLRSS